MSNTESAQPTDITYLYTAHHHWLRNWLRQQVGCSETAADLAQDTFVRLMRRDQQGLELQSPKAYLTRIARGLMINLWRRQDIERAYLETLMLQPEPTLPSAEEQLLIIETLLRVDAMLRDLPTAVRQAFLMSRVDGLKYNEIAVHLNVSERTIKSYMAKAMFHCLLLTESDA